MKKEDLYQKIESTIEDSKSFLENSIPDLKHFQELRKLQTIQEELVKYNQELVQCSKNYSQIQANLLYLSELQEKGENNLSIEEKKGFSQDIEEYKERLKKILYALKNRNENLSLIIETLRSLQSHSTSTSDF